jgi:hypothetical protein
VLLLVVLQRRRRSKTGPRGRGHGQDAAASKKVAELSLPPLAPSMPSLPGTVGLSLDLSTGFTALLVVDVRDILHVLLASKGGVRPTVAGIATKAGFVLATHTATTQQPSLCCLVSRRHPPT